MKTTLKRGIGRGASVDGNGNGSGNGHAALGAIAVPRFSRYRQPPAPPRRKLALVGKAFLWLVLAAAVVAGSLLGGAYLYGGDFVKSISPHTLAMKHAAQRLTYASPGKPAVTLVIGSDRRWDQKGLPSRSDTLMLIRTDPTTKTISMLSLPRDLLVDIKCPAKGGGISDYGLQKINAAFATCGPAGTLETVKALTNVPINYLISVNFLGFIQVVDRLGGVWMDVDRRYFNNHTGPTGYAAINLYPGYQRLGGKQALDFVRYRHTDSDLYRVARQQMFVRAVKERMNSFHPTAVPKLVSAIKNNVEVGRAGGGGPTLGTLENYAFFLYNLPPGHFSQVQIDGLSGLSDLTTDSSNITAAVQQFLNPDPEAPAKASAAAGVKVPVKKRAVHVRPASVSITVLNGNGVAGSAATAGAALHGRGYRIATPPPTLSANAPDGWNHVRSKVYFDRRRPHARAAAAQVAKLIGEADVASVPRNYLQFTSGATLLVIVGRTFTGSLAAPPVYAQIRHQPAYVSSNPTAMLSYLRQARRRVPFRLENPTVLERSSRPDSELPVNTYTLNGHKALRMTFALGANEFWGIEETNWTQAPVLREKNFQRTIGGRRYGFYYSGPHLHMVVLYANGASYWVVNTLLDRMSNETMIAIARGLRPL